MQQLDLFADQALELNTPFTDRAVCLVGKFRMAKNELKKRLTSMGAELKDSVSRNVHFVVLGNEVPEAQQEKLLELQANGFHPRTLSATDLNNILEGHYAGYEVEKEIQKDLHITVQHYLRFRPTLTKGSNPLYTHELYIAPDTQTEQHTLYQLLGNRGIYANPYMDDTTDVLVVSDATIQRLERGETDDTLRYIQQQYNTSRAQSYNYAILTESELLAWLTNG